jgi:LacI family transcriptional regulator
MARPRKPQSVTIIDVAREANVSYSTVSRVVNGFDHVKPEKRQRVLEAMERLGYVANAQARSLAGGRSQVIGLLVRDFAHAYTGEVLRGIDAELAPLEYDLMLYTSHHRNTKESVYINKLTQGVSDGLLLLLPLDPGAYLETLHQRQFPYVVIDHQGFDDFSPTVAATNWQGAFEATRYLIELGHTRIGHITGRMDVSSALERLQGYQAALASSNIAFTPELVANGYFEQQEGYVAAQTLLNLPQPPTAIFAANDASAIGAVEAIRSHGLSIPEDVSVVGFDDIPQAASLYPALTTVRQPLSDMGRAATRLLLKYIEDPTLPNERIVLPTELIVRASCSEKRR